MPFSYHRTFSIEARFGFNKMTRAMWIGDLVKHAAVASALGLPLVYHSGRPGSQIYVAAGPAGIPGFYPTDHGIALQFRRGRLTGCGGSGTEATSTFSARFCC